MKIEVNWSWRGQRLDGWLFMLQTCLSLSDTQMIGLSEIIFVNMSSNTPKRKKNRGAPNFQKRKPVSNELFIDKLYLSCYRKQFSSHISLNNKNTRIFNLSIYFRIVLDFRVLAKCLGWRRPQSIASGHPPRTSIFIHKLNTVLRSSLHPLLFVNNHRSTDLGNQTVWR